MNKNHNLIVHAIRSRNYPQLIYKNCSVKKVKSIKKDKAASEKGFEKCFKEKSKNS